MQRKLNSKRKILLVLSAAAQGFFLFDANLCSLFLAFFFVCFALCMPSPGTSDRPAGIRWLPAVLQTAGLIRFCQRWASSKTVVRAAGSAGISGHTLSFLLLSAGLILGLAGCFFLSETVRFFLQEETPREVPRGQRDGGPAENRRAFACCVLCTLLAAAVCSECSLLYPINSHVNQNCFFTVGRAWMNGMVPYRDLFEQKGPLLYLVYGAGSLVSRGGFFGIFLIELVSGSAFLYLIYRTCGLYARKRTPAVIPAAALAVYTAKSFSTGGGPEELCLPLFAYALYLGLASVLESRSIRWMQFFLVGLSAGIVLWTKFTFAGFFLGWAMYFSFRFLRKRDSGAFGRMMTGIAAGVCIITLPVLLYFRSRGALQDLVQVYLLDNIRLYSGYQGGGFLTGILRNYWTGIGVLADGSFLILFLIALGLMRDRTGLLLICFAFLFGTSFAGQYSWAYYALVFAPFISPGLVPVAEKTGRLAGFVRKHSAPAVIAFVVSCAALSPNAVRIGTKKASLPQYQMAEVIREREAPTLLNYGFLDGGFYLAADVLPNCRAFCRLNAPIPEMYRLQDEFLETARCDFVVTKAALGLPFYELVLQSGDYYLYQKRDG